MKKIIRSQYWVFALVLAGLQGCVNLTALHSYTETSVEGLNTFSETGFSFKKICENDCELNLKVKGIAEKTGPKAPMPIREKQECKCDVYIQADSAFSKLNFVVTGYFEGLHKLSSDEIFDFKYDTLAKALHKSELLKIDEKEIMAYNGVVKIITKFVVDVKRRKDLKTIITKADKSIKLLLQKMETIAGKMKEALENETSLEYNYYKEILIANKKSMDSLKTARFSPKDIIDVENDFMEKRAAYDGRIEALDKYQEMLVSIRKGHDELVKNIDKVTKKELTAFIAGYVTEIKVVKKEFDNLKEK